MTIHKDLGPRITAVVIVLGSSVLISMGLRAYVRITRRSWGVEDWAMAIACAPLIILSIFTAAGSYHGIGAKDGIFTLSENRRDVEIAYLCFFVFQVSYCATMMLVKLSIGLMLNRIAETKKLFIYVNYCFITLAITTNLATALYIIFQCNPISAAWKDGLRRDGTHCRPADDLEIVYYVCSAVNISTDWATALMPIVLLWNVQMNRNTKISVAGILGLGFFTSISGLVRLKYIPGLTEEEEYSYGLGQIFIWGYAEPALGMLIGNIATLRPLFTRILRLGSDRPSQTYSHETPRIFTQNKNSDPYPSFDIELIDNTAIDKEIKLTFADPNQGVRSSVSTDLEGQTRAGDMADDVELMTRQKSRILVSHEVEVRHEVDVYHESNEAGHK